MNGGFSLCFHLCITFVVVCAVPVRPGVSTSEHTSRIMRLSLGTDSPLLELDPGSSSGRHNQHNSPSHKLQFFLKYFLMIYLTLICIGVKVSDLVELHFQTVVSCHVGAGN